MRRSPVTSDDIKRWKSQGLGQGEGAAYRPWIDVRAFSSKGRASRAPGLTTGRTHHLLSDIEDKFCLLADYAPNTIDIREQFPLLPEESTQQIAHQLSILHPRYPNSKTPLVMTTDFLLTISDGTGTPAYLAVSIKKADDLRGTGRARVLAKLEIERRYWLMRNVPWQLVTDDDLDETIIANLDWLNYLSVDSHVDARLLGEQAPKFLTAFRIASQDNSSLQRIIHACTASIGGIDDEFAYQLFRYAAWHHLIDLDLTIPVGPRRTPKVIAIADDVRQDALDGNHHEH
jgi:hypothetical protein